MIEDAVRRILGETRLRSRGPTPELTDVEALTIEIFGETLGLNSDASIWRYASDHLRDWFPEGGMGKTFCVLCGSSVMGRKQDCTITGVRLGALDSDPGIRPSFHQFVAYAASWEPIPDDGLPRYPERGN